MNIFKGRAAERAASLEAIVKQACNGVHKPTEVVVKWDTIMCGGEEQLVPTLNLKFKKTGGLLSE